MPSRIITIPSKGKGRGKNARRRRFTLNGKFQNAGSECRKEGSRENQLGSLKFVATHHNTQGLSCTVRRGQQRIWQLLAMSSVFQGKKVGVIAYLSHLRRYIVLRFRGDAPSRLQKFVHFVSLSYVAELLILVIACDILSRWCLLVFSYRDAYICGVASIIAVRPPDLAPCTVSACHVLRAYATYAKSAALMV